MFASVSRGRESSAKARWLVVVASAVGLAASCATSDEPVSVAVHNDLSHAVRMQVCESNDCSKTGDSWLLKPDQIGRPNVDPQTGYNSVILTDMASASRR
jgi:hypothetical protein